MTTPTAASPPWPLPPALRTPSGTTAGCLRGLADRSRVDNRRTPWTKRASPGSVAGACLRRGEFRLPLAEGLLGAAAAPVPGNGRPLRVDAPFLADVGPQVVHDDLRLAVDEDLHLAGKPLRLLHRRDERCEVTGMILRHQVGP